MKRKIRPAIPIYKPLRNGTYTVSYIFNSDCVGCGLCVYPREYVMLRPEIWNRCKPADDGDLLCLGCIEDQLKRKLTRDDFSTDEEHVAGLNILALGGQLSERCLRRLGFKKSRRKVTYWGDPYEKAPI